MLEVLVKPSAVASSPQKRESLWTKALVKFKRDKIGLISFIVVAVYLVIALLVWTGFIAQDWDAMMGSSFSAPTMEHWFGTNINGQDIFQRAIYSTKTAFEVGLTVAIFATIMGALFGCITGYFSGSVLDEFILWIMNSIDCIPYFLMVAAIAVALEGSPYSMHFAMTLAFWTGTARVVRGEVIKLKSMEFVEAAHSLGVPTYRVIFKHLMPNTMHLLLVDMTLLFITAIKSEVILSFLGLGIKDSISWG
ncbi:ABC transporter permease [Vibrio lentus]